MNATAIYNTCQSMIIEMPLIDSSIVLLKTQWLMIVTTFLLLPFIFYLIYVRKLNNGGKISKTTVREMFLSHFFMLFIFQLITFFIFLSTDFSFINGIINSLR